MARHAALALFVALSIASGAAQAQGRRPHVIGYLHPQSAGPADPSSAPQIIEQELARLGYIEGTTVRYERRYADGKPELFAPLAADLVGRKVDIIIAQTTNLALAAKRATQTIPIVFVASGDAVGSGLVASLARPGGNATGNSFLGTELAIKQLELVRELAPTATRIAFVGNRSLPPEPLFFRQMQEPARTLRFDMVFIDVRGPEGFARIVPELQTQQAQAAIWAPGGYTDRAADRASLMQATAGIAIPSIFFRREFVESGSLASYGPRFPDLYRKAARYVDRILKGESPAELPVQQPTEFELVVNLKAARSLGIVVPPSTLAGADEVIE